MTAGTIDTQTTAADLPANATPEQARAALLRALAEARRITDAAVAAERELTDQEHQQVKSLLEEADLLDGRLRILKAKASGGFSVNAEEVRDLGIGAPLGAGPASKAHRGSGWSKAVIRANSDEYGRFKGLTPSGTVLVDVPAPDPVEFGRPVNSVRALVPTQASTGQFAFLRQTLRELNAAPVAPGTKKPTSIFRFERVSDTCKTIAHLTEPLHRADLSDSPLLQDYVQTELFYGLSQAVDDEIVNGDGTGEHFLGLANTPGILTVGLTGSTDFDRIATIRRGMTSLEAVGLSATAILLHPLDWEQVEMTITDDGALVLQGAEQTVPVDSAARRLFGVTVVASVACTPGTAWVADLWGSTRLWERESARLDWSQDVYDPNLLGTGIGGSLFETNQIRFRAEGRWGFAVTRSTGIVRCTIS